MRTAFFDGEGQTFEGRPQYSSICIDMHAYQNSIDKTEVLQYPDTNHNNILLSILFIIQRSDLTPVITACIGMGSGPMRNCA